VVNWARNAPLERTDTMKSARRARNPDQDDISSWVHPSLDSLTSNGLGIRGGQPEPGESPVAFQDMNSLFQQECEARARMTPDTTSDAATEQKNMVKLTSYPYGPLKEPIFDKTLWPETLSRPEPGQGYAEISLQTQHFGKNLARRYHQAESNKETSNTASSETASRGLVSAESALNTVCSSEGGKENVAVQEPESDALRRADYARTFVQQAKASFGTPLPIPVPERPQPPILLQRLITQRQERKAVDLQSIFVGLGDKVTQFASAREVQRYYDSISRPDQLDRTSEVTASTVLSEDRQTHMSSVPSMDGAPDATRNSRSISSSDPVQALQAVIQAQAKEREVESSDLTAGAPWALFPPSLPSKQFLQRLLRLAERALDDEASGDAATAEAHRQQTDQKKYLMQMRVILRARAAAAAALRLGERPRVARTIIDSALKSVEIMRTRDVALKQATRSHSGYNTLVTATNSNQVSSPESQRRFEEDIIENFGSFYGFPNREAVFDLKVKSEEEKSLFLQATGRLYFSAAAAIVNAFSGERSEDAASRHSRTSPEEAYEREMHLIEIVCDTLFSDDEGATALHQFSASPAIVGQESKLSEEAERQLAEFGVCEEDMSKLHEHALARAAEEDDARRSWGVGDSTPTLSPSTATSDPPAFRNVRKASDGMISSTYWKLDNATRDKYGLLSVTQALEALRGRSKYDVSSLLSYADKSVLNYLATNFRLLDESPEGKQDEPVPELVAFENPNALLKYTPHSSLEVLEATDLAPVRPVRPATPPALRRALKRAMLRRSEKSAVEAETTEGPLPDHAPDVDCINDRKSDAGVKIPSSSETQAVSTQTTVSKVPPSSPPAMKDGVKISSQGAARTDETALRKVTQSVKLAEAFVQRQNTEAASQQSSDTVVAPGASTQLPRPKPRKPDPSNPIPLSTINAVREASRVVTNVFSKVSHPDQPTGLGLTGSQPAAVCGAVGGSGMGGGGLAGAAIGSHTSDSLNGTAYGASVAVGKHVPTPNLVHMLPRKDDKHADPTNTFIPSRHKINIMKAGIASSHLPRALVAAAKSHGVSVPHAPIVADVKVRTSRSHEGTGNASDAAVSFEAFVENKSLTQIAQLAAQSARHEIIHETLRYASLSEATRLKTASRAESLSSAAEQDSGSANSSSSAVMPTLHSDTPARPVIEHLVSDIGIISLAQRAEMAQNTVAQAESVTTRGDTESQENHGKAQSELAPSKTLDGSGDMSIAHVQQAVARTLADVPAQGEATNMLASQLAKMTARRPFDSTAETASRAEVMKRSIERSIKNGRRAWRAGSALMYSQTTSDDDVDAVEDDAPRDIDGSLGNMSTGNSRQGNTTITSTMLRPLSQRFNLVAEPKLLPSGSESYKSIIRAAKHRHALRVARGQIHTAPGVGLSEKYVYAPPRHSAKLVKMAIEQFIGAEPDRSSTPTELLQLELKRKHDERLQQLEAANAAEQDGGGSASKTTKRSKRRKAGPSQKNKSRRKNAAGDNTNATSQLLEEDRETDDPGSELAHAFDIPEATFDKLCERASVSNNSRRRRPPAPHLGSSQRPSDRAYTPVEYSYENRTGDRSVTFLAPNARQRAQLWQSPKRFSSFGPNRGGATSAQSSIKALIPRQAASAANLDRSLTVLSTQMPQDVATNPMAADGWRMQEDPHVVSALREAAHLKTNSQERSSKADPEIEFENMDGEESDTESSLNINNLAQTRARALKRRKLQARFLSGPAEKSIRFARAWGVKRVRVSLLRSVRGGGGVPSATDLFYPQIHFSVQDEHRRLLRELAGAPRTGVAPASGASKQAPTFPTAPRGLLYPPEPDRISAAKLAASLSALSAKQTKMRTRRNLVLKPLHSTLAPRVKGTVRWVTGASPNAVASADMNRKKNQQAKESHQHITPLHKIRLRAKTHSIKKTLRETGLSAGIIESLRQGIAPSLAGIVQHRFAALRKAKHEREVLTGKRLTSIQLLRKSTTPLPGSSSLTSTKRQSSTLISNLPRSKSLRPKGAKEAVAKTGNRVSAAQYFRGSIAGAGPAGTPGVSFPLAERFFSPLGVTAAGARAYAARVSQGSVDSESEALELRVATSLAGRFVTRSMLRQELFNSRAPIEFAHKVSQIGYLQGRRRKRVTNQRLLLDRLPSTTSTSVQEDRTTESKSQMKPFVVGNSVEELQSLYWQPSDSEDDEDETQGKSTKDLAKPSSNASALSDSTKAYAEFSKVGESVGAGGGGRTGLVIEHLAVQKMLPKSLQKATQTASKTHLQQSSHPSTSQSAAPMELDDIDEETTDMLSDGILLSDSFGHDSLQSMFIDERKNKIRQREKRRMLQMKLVQALQASSNKDYSTFHGTALTIWRHVALMNRSSKLAARLGSRAWQQIESARAIYARHTIRSSMRRVQRLDDPMDSRISPHLVTGTGQDAVAFVFPQQDSDTAGATTSPDSTREIPVTGHEWVKHRFEDASVPREVIIAGSLATKVGLRVRSQLTRSAEEPATETGSGSASGSNAVADSSGAQQHGSDAPLISKLALQAGSPATNYGLVLDPVLSVHDLPLPYQPESAASDSHLTLQFTVKRDSSTNNANLADSPHVSHTSVSIVTNKPRLRNLLKTAAAKIRKQSKPDFANAIIKAELSGDQAEEARVDDVHSSGMTATEKEHALNRDGEPSEDLSAVVLTRELSRPGLVREPSQRPDSSPPPEHRAERPAAFYSTKLRRNSIADLVSSLPLLQAAAEQERREEERKREQERLAQRDVLTKTMWVDPSSSSASGLGAQPLPGSDTPMFVWSRLATLGRVAAQAQARDARTAAAAQRRKEQEQAQAREKLRKAALRQVLEVNSPEELGNPRDEITSSIATVNSVRRNPLVLGGDERRQVLWSTIIMLVNWLPRKIEYHTQDEFNRLKSIAAPQTDDSKGHDDSSETLDFKQGRHGSGTLLENLEPLPDLPPVPRDNAEWCRDRHSSRLKPRDRRIDDTIDFNYEALASRLIPIEPNSNILVLPESVPTSGIVWSDSAQLPPETNRTSAGPGADGKPLISRLIEQHRAELERRERRRQERAANLPIFKRLATLPGPASKVVAAFQAHGLNLSDVFSPLRRPTLAPPPPIVTNFGTGANGLNLQGLQDHVENFVRMPVTFPDLTTHSVDRYLNLPLRERIRISALIRMKKDPAWRLRLEDAFIEEQQQDFYAKSHQEHEMSVKQQEDFEREMALSKKRIGSKFRDAPGSSHHERGLLTSQTRSVDGTISVIKPPRQLVPMPALPAFPRVLGGGQPHRRIFHIMVAARLANLRRQRMDARRNRSLELSTVAAFDNRGLRDKRDRLAEMLLRRWMRARYKRRQDNAADIIRSFLFECAARPYLPRVVAIYRQRVIAVQRWWRTRVRPSVRARRRWLLALWMRVHSDVERVLRLADYCDYLRVVNSNVERLLPPDVLKLPSEYLIYYSPSADGQIEVQLSATQLARVRASRTKRMSSAGGDRRTSLVQPQGVHPTLHFPVVVSPRRRTSIASLTDENQGLSCLTTENTEVTQDSPSGSLQSSAIPRRASVVLEPETVVEQLTTLGSLSTAKGASSIILSPQATAGYSRRLSFGTLGPLSGGASAQTVGTVTLPQTPTAAKPPMFSPLQVQPGPAIFVATGAWQVRVIDHEAFEGGAQATLVIERNREAPLVCVSSQSASINNLPRIRVNSVGAPASGATGGDSGAGQRSTIPLTDMLSPERDLVGVPGLLDPFARELRISVPRKPRLPTQTAPPVNASVQPPGAQGDSAVAKTATQMGQNAATLPRLTRRQSIIGEMRSPDTILSAKPSVEFSQGGSISINTGRRLSISLRGGAVTYLPPNPPTGLGHDTQRTTPQEPSALPAFLPMLSVDPANDDTSSNRSTPTSGIWPARPKATGLGRLTLRAIGSVSTPTNLTQRQDSHLGTAIAPRPTPTRKNRAFFAQENAFLARALRLNGGVVVLRNVQLPSVVSSGQPGAKPRTIYDVLATMAAPPPSGYGDDRDRLSSVRGFGRGLAGQPGRFAAWWLKDDTILSSPSAGRRLSITLPPSTPRSQEAGEAESTTQSSGASPHLDDLNRLPDSLQCPEMRFQKPVYLGIPVAVRAQILEDLYQQIKREWRRSAECMRMRSHSALLLGVAREQFAADALADQREYVQRVRRASLGLEAMPTKPLASSSGELELLAAVSASESATKQASELGGENDELEHKSNVEKPELLGLRNERDVDPHAQESRLKRLFPWKLSTGVTPPECARLWHQFCSLDRMELTIRKALEKSYGNEVPLSRASERVLLGNLYAVQQSNLKDAQTML